MSRLHSLTLVDAQALISVALQENEGNADRKDGSTFMDASLDPLVVQLLSAHTCHVLLTSLSGACYLDRSTAAGILYADTANCTRVALDRALRLRAQTC